MPEGEEVQVDLQRAPGNGIFSDAAEPESKIQHKLPIGPANDPYEQEADQVAEKVVSMNEPQLGNSTTTDQRISRTPPADSITPLQRSAKSEEEIHGALVQRKCAMCEKEEAQAKKLRRLVNPANLCPKCRSHSSLQMMQRKYVIQTKGAGFAAPVHTSTGLSASVESAI